MNIFDEINGWTPEELLSRINLPMAKDGKSWICPLCDNGAGGGTGDGIKPRNSKGQTRWKCFKCDKDFSNFDLAAAMFGYDAERETAEAAKRLKEEFLLYDDNETFSFSRKKESARTDKFAVSTSVVQSEAGAMREQKKSASEGTPKNYAKMFKFCRGNVEKFLAERGGSFRGLTAETFEKYGLGVHPEFGLEGQEKLPTLIIPYDDNHFVARAVDSDRRPTQHGQDAGIYEPLPIGFEYPNFISEGEIDALSVIQAVGSFGISCIATGGASKHKKVVAELEKRFGDVAEKPSFIVLFDNDKTGKDNALQLVTELRTAGYPAETFFFEEETAGTKYIVKNSDGTENKIEVPKVDANDLLQKNSYALTDALFNALDRLDAPLRAQKEAMKASVVKERQEEENRSGIKELSFSEYFATKFFSEVALTAKYSSRKTGFSNIDAAQVFIPGLYFLGALPATGKTTFAWQMLNQLADGGENCIYCSYEMSMLELYTKSITRELFKMKQSGRPVLAPSSGDIRRGAGLKVDDVQSLAKKFSLSKIKLRVMELSHTPVEELIKKLSSVVAEAEKPPVVVLDYLQIMPHSKDTAKAAIDDTLLRLKDFQRATNSTLIIISSFNRENYWQAASFNSFKESGAIEYGADSVWALQNYIDDDISEETSTKEKMIKASKQPIRKVKFLCLKNRNGGAYDCLFQYYAAHDYFEALEEENSGSRDYEY